MKLVLFTFDYELFLGERSGTVQDCMIQPTNRLLSLFKKYNYKALFFVDTVYLLRLKQEAIVHPKAATDLQNIQFQLTEAVKAGHEIHPHIHAHWLDAVYNVDSNDWSLTDTKYYRFAALSVDKQTELFDNSVALIREIIQNAGSKQPVDAYRAGGWSIQPFTAFLPFFKKHGFKHEFSVIPGKYHVSDAHTYDFRNAPVKDTYHFEDDVNKEQPNGSFKEWCISTVSFNNKTRWIYFKINSLYKRLAKKSVYKGRGVKATTAEQGDTYVPQGGMRYVASFEQLNPYMVWRYTSLIKNTGYFQFISHPKLIFESDFTMLKSLLARINNIKNIETDFRKAA
jgi:hypothetical protein